MIGAKRVTAPDGTTWRVGRRWLPKKPVLVRKKWFGDSASDGRELAWRAAGFRRSGRVRDDVAAALVLGHRQIEPSEALRATP